MGIFINPNNSAFQVALGSEIYIDKTTLLSYTNRVIGTKEGFICNSRPRRFGKSTTADMLVAYYSKGCNSEKMFHGLDISRKADFKIHLNSYNVIRIDVQWCRTCVKCAKATVSYIEENIINELQETYPDTIPAGIKSLPDALAAINKIKGEKFVIIIDEWDSLIRDEAENIELQEEYKSYWSMTGTYVSIIPLINMDFDGLKSDIIKMLSGDSVEIEVSTFQNDMITFEDKNDVLTLLIHLGYLAYDEKKRKAFIPNEEIRFEFAKAIKRRKWNELTALQIKSEKLLLATLDMDAEKVADIIEEIHMDYTSSIQYNNENSLSSILSIAYLSAMQYYFKPIRECPAGRGFADLVLLPKKEYPDMPALLLELKWNQSVISAIKQIKDKNYVRAVDQYTGNILLIGISYDKKQTKHQCIMEKYFKINQQPTASHCKQSVVSYNS